jgi:hypothetical protein
MAYNGALKIIDNLVSTLNPTGSLFQALAKVSMLKKLGMEWKPLKQVIFVATQADRVQRNDLQQGKLHVLLNDMVAGIRQRNEPLKSETAVCSAIWSQADGQNPSSLPDKLPDTFAAGDYDFPRIQGNFPAVKTNSPKHHQLDDIFNLIIN